ncbi:MAG: DUF5395 family protein [Bacteroidetes bacterium]|jgi:hypothetical protein|nr:DUF5395 family protein [Bacteroidota bacterium]MBT6685675.1 DUF5395 family protein [Bacteroidota bacterium]MBT7141899.1 DUF5395 family protein [Bacteroidota bacterium]MBT7491024.1 DUF5395 family protein [Bacteroidota bacterium]
MPYKIELKLTMNGADWQAENNEINVSAPTLPELDTKIGKVLKNSNIYKNVKLFHIYMYFDQETIPEWIRQYSNHYFNRILEIENN